MSENNDNNIQIRRGTFKVVNKVERIKLFFVMGVICTTIVIILSLLSFGEETDSLFDTMVWVCFGMLALVGIFWAVLSSSREYSYESLESEFVVTDDRGGREIFYYSDVQDISFSRFKSGINRTGYVVTVTTGVRTLEYRCLTVGDRTNTPFYLLGVNAGILEPVVAEPVDSALILSQFEDMHREQMKNKMKKKRGRNGNRIDSAEDFFDIYGKGDSNDK